MRRFFPFVADGRRRAYEAVRAEVVAEFAERLKTATRWQRVRLWWAIEAEAKRRLRKRFPPRGLFARSRA
jgi:hypothetical protein